MGNININPQICVKIAIYNGCQVEEVIYYRNKLPMRIIEKWRWYFEYLAALVKVHNPRRKVELTICVQTLLQGHEYIAEKSKTLLRAKRAQVKRLDSTNIINDDLFGYQTQQLNARKERIQAEIEALERGEFNYYIPPTYINRLKRWLK